MTMDNREVMSKVGELEPLQSLTYKGSSSYRVAGFHTDNRLGKVVRSRGSYHLPLCRHRAAASNEGKSCTTRKAECRPGRGCTPDSRY
jgi:hypothetical protein